MVSLRGEEQIPDIWKDKHDRRGKSSGGASNSILRSQIKSATEEPSMLSYDEAREIVINTVAALPAEEVELYQALGRVLAAPAFSQWDLPPADNSAMDGYACITANLNAGDELVVSDFLPAGQYCTTRLTEGHAIKIMTGAPIPTGCDTVIPIEEVLEFPGRIRLIHPPKPDCHIRRRGEELGKGELLVSPGTQLSAGELAVLASGGAERVHIYPAPKVAILSTGDELVELGRKPVLGQIINSNFYLLTANLRLAGAEVISLGTASDTSGDLEKRLELGMAADMIITTGGVSVGDRDLVQETLLKMGFERKFWRAKIKPGKPILFGTLLNKPVFGLPGNPTSAAVTFELFVRPALRLMAGFKSHHPTRHKAILSASVRGDDKRQLFTWGTLEEKDGIFWFHPSSRQGSGQNRSLQGANALLPMPLGINKLEKFCEVEVLTLLMSAQTFG